MNTKYIDGGGDHSVYCDIVPLKADKSNRGMDPRPRSSDQITLGTALLLKDMPLGHPAYLHGWGHKRLLNIK
jgi:hypothetical protein